MSQRSLKRLMHDGVEPDDVRVRTYQYRRGADVPHRNRKPSRPYPRDSQRERDRRIAQANRWLTA
jgi:hypothetical protein